MINKVVFIVFGMSPRIDRRIREFIANDFDVEVYGGRSESSRKYEGTDAYQYNAIYEIGETSTYRERMKNLPKFNAVMKKFDRKTTLFYFFSLNTAVLFLINPGIRYIYEESDMLFDRFHKRYLRKLVIMINKRIIRKSVLTVFTSEGFADYYFGDERPDNLVVIPNRVSPDVRNYPIKKKQTVDFEHLKFGFAGNVRYKAIMNVTDVVVENYPGHEFHYHGDIVATPKEWIDHLKELPRVFIHSSYKYPSGLSEVYGNLDFVVCTYDAKGVNPCYAEPNKLYEAIYFETPIIVSSNTFLAKKVEKLGIGFAVNADDKADIYSKLQQLTPERYQSFVEAMQRIPKEQSLNINKNFFKLLKQSIKDDVNKITPPISN